MSRWTPNRIVALATGALGTAGAAVALLADLSGPQGAAFAASALVVLGIANRWLVGWQKWEASQGRADAPLGAETALGLLEALTARVDDLARAERPIVHNLDTALRPELSEAEVAEVAEAVAGRLRDETPR